MSLSRLHDILNAGRKVGEVVTAIGQAAEPVEEVAPHFTGGAASSIGYNQTGNAPGAPPTGWSAAGMPVQPAVTSVFPGMPLTGIPNPFFVPPVQVSEDELRTEADIRTKFLLSKLRLGSGVFRNMLGEIIAKSGDEELVRDWHRTQGDIAAPAGSMVAKAVKRLKVRNRLKTYQSSIMADDENELVELMREALYQQLKEDAQAGKFRKMGFDGMVARLVATEFCGMAEALVEPLTELVKDNIKK